MDTNSIIWAIVVGLAVITIGALELSALSYGLDGTSLAAAFTILGGLGGFAASKVKVKAK